MNEILAFFEKTIALKRNEYLQLKGNIDTNIYYVVSGSLRIYVLDDNEEQIIRFGYENDFIVCIDSFLTSETTDFYIQAIKQTIVKVIPKKNLTAFLNLSETNKLIWNKVLEDLILQQVEREKDILTSSPLTRYNRVLNRSPKLFQKIPHKHIANYLRMSPETLSRLKKS
jgi:CRP/FNR family transcriptional regulator, anaerobic regulatory protein